MTRPFRRILPLLAIATAALTIAACGDSSSPSSAAGDSDEEKQLAFADCLRDQGLEVSSSGDGRFGIRMSSRSGDGGGKLSSSTDRAFETCRKQTGWAPRPPSEAQQQEARDRALEFARCMREHGVDMADPSSDGRVLLRVQEGDSATVRRAQEACGGGPAAPAQPAP